MISKNKITDINKCRDTGLAMLLLVLLIMYFGKYYNLVPLAIIILIISILFPKLFGPLAKVWFKFSNLVGNIMSKVILSIIFYIVVMPVGIIRRIFFKPYPLQLRDWKKETTSVFKIRDQEIRKDNLDNPY